jgi:hypothetical protein
MWYSMTMLGNWDYMYDGTVGWNGPWISNDDEKEAIEFFN